MSLGVRLKTKSHFRHTGKVGSSSWDDTQGSGPWGGTLGWDPGEDPRVGPQSETLALDSEAGPLSGTLG